MKITRRKLRNLTQAVIGQLTETAVEFTEEQQVEDIRTLGDDAIKAAKGGDWGPGATTARGLYDEITSSVLGTDGQHSNAIDKENLDGFQEEIEGLIKSAEADLARNTDTDISEMKITRKQLRLVINEELRLLEVVDTDDDGKLSPEELRRMADDLDGGVGPMKSKRLYKDAREKIKNLGLALSPDQIQDLANTDPTALAVYDNLIQDSHPGILSQNIRQAYDQSDDFTMSWEEHKENVQNTLASIKVREIMTRNR